MKKTLLMIVVAMYALTACNTMKGLGEDVQKVGFVQGGRTVSRGSCAHGAPSVRGFATLPV